MSLILYLRLTHTILCLDNIHYNVLQQFDTLGDGINFISLINAQKLILSRRNVSIFSNLLKHLIKRCWTYTELSKRKNKHTNRYLYIWEWHECSTLTWHDIFMVQHYYGMILLQHEIVACGNIMALHKKYEHTHWYFDRWG